MFSDLLALIINMIVYHFNYSLFLGSNFYSFKISPYMFYLKANEEHLEKGSSICIFPEREEKKKITHTHTKTNKNYFSRKCMTVNT